jgi:3-dehydroquinate synthase
MRSLHQSFSVNFTYDVLFTEGIFKKNNPSVKNVVENDGTSGLRKFLIIIDEGVSLHHPKLITSIHQYFEAHQQTLNLKGDPIIVPGGEQAKNEPQLVQDLLAVVNSRGIDRHSYIMAIGGGAVLDIVGYVASIAHRGIRHIRVPTTVLSQNDSGIGVKNGINAFNKKNFLGVFDPPYAVIVDFNFLLTLDDRDWRSGISEAIKVALIKDKEFFKFLEKNKSALVNRNLEVMKNLIHRCAEMHLQHIASKDPFETGSSRPLDFGHWAAHKLEQLTSFEIRHGEAVAIGMALDTTYSYLSGMLSKEEWEATINLISQLGFELFVPELLQKNLKTGEFEVLTGLNEFREHLGGKLTIMVLTAIGTGVELHEMDDQLIIESIKTLQKQENLKYIH